MSTILPDAPSWLKSPRVSVLCWLQEGKNSVFQLHAANAEVGPGCLADSWLVRADSGDAEALGRGLARLAPACGFKARRWRSDSACYLIRWAVAGPHLSTGRQRRLVEVDEPGTINGLRGRHLAAREVESHLNREHRA